MKQNINVKKVIKKILSFLKIILPELWVNRCYVFVFPKYKLFIRTLYNLKVISYHIVGKKEAVKMSKLVYSVMSYTLVGARGLEATYRLTELMNIRRIKGSFVELGVARGGCAALMARIAFENVNGMRDLWLFDSFEGLPDPTDNDFLSSAQGKTTGEHIQPLVRGSCLATIDEVEELLFEKFSFPRNHIYLTKGWFQDTLPITKEKVGEIAVLRIDGDWYESTKCCLENLYDQVVSGGVIIVDDYESCFGCKKALDEFMDAENIITEIVMDGRGGCYFFKE